MKFCQVKTNRYGIQGITLPLRRNRNAAFKTVAKMNDLKSNCALCIRAFFQCKIEILLNDATDDFHR